MINVYDVYTLEKVLLNFGYKKSECSGSCNIFLHDKLPEIMLSKTGSYQKKQVIDIVVKRIGLNSFEKFLEIYDYYKPKSKIK